MKVLFVYLSMFYLNLGQTQDFKPVIDPKKFNACFATINSSDEKNEFLKKLDKTKFNVVELTDFDKDKKDKENSPWFDNACASNITCDILVISGHFGGTFFGKSGLKLGTSTLERKSCDESCKGILNYPKEVFLFGCNTLNSKADNGGRTPEEYYDVLIREGVDSETARNQVDEIFSPFGTDTRSRMQRLFSGSENLYGFSSIAPSGENVKEALGNYLANIGPYDQHILKLSVQQMNRKLGELNQDENILLQKILSELNSSFSQCKALDPKDKNYKIKQKLCEILSDNITPENKVPLILNALNSEDKNIYLPTIIDVWKSNPQYLSQYRSHIMELSQRDLGPRKNLDILSLVNRLEPIKDFRLKYHQLLMKYISPLTNRNQVDLFCDKIDNSFISADVRSFNYDEFPKNVLQSNLFPYLVSCFNTDDVKLQQHEFDQFYKSKDKSQEFLSAIFAQTEQLSNRKTHFNRAQQILLLQKHKKAASDLLVKESKFTKRQADLFLNLFIDYKDINSFVEYVKIIASKKEITTFDSFMLVFLTNSELGENKKKAKEILQLFDSNLHLSKDFRLYYYLLNSKLCGDDEELKSKIEKRLIENLKSENISRLYYMILKDKPKIQTGLQDFIISDILNSKNPNLYGFKILKQNINRLSDSQLSDLNNHLKTIENNHSDKEIIYKSYLIQSLLADTKFGNDAYKNTKSNYPIKDCVVDDYNPESSWYRYPSVTCE